MVLVSYQLSLICSFSSEGVKIIVIDIVQTSDFKKFENLENLGELSLRSY